jgi:small multidrug resistance pump
MKFRYLFLALTILFDSLGIGLLNKADGTANLKFLLPGLALVNLGLVALSYALKYLDVTIANTTFAGMSSVLVAGIGYYFFDERYTLFQYCCLALVLFGLVGLNLTGVSK